MPRRAAFHKRHPFAFNGVGNNHNRPAFEFFHPAKSLLGSCKIMAIDFNHRPIKCLPACTQRIQPHDIFIQGGLGSVALKDEEFLQAMKELDAK